MAQALGISLFSDSAPPQAPKSNANSSDGGPSKFDDALDSARQNFSSDAPKSSEASDSTHRSSKTADSKPAKPAAAKSTVKARASKTDKADKADDSKGTDGADDSAADGTTSSSSKDTPDTDEAQGATTKADPKAKPAAHAADPSTALPPSQVSASPQQNPAANSNDAQVKGKGNSSNDPSADVQSSQLSTAPQKNPAAKPSDTQVKEKGNSGDPSLAASTSIQPVEKSPATQETDVTQDAQADENSAASAKSAPAPVNTSTADSSDRESAGLRAKDASNEASESATANSAAIVAPDAAEPAISDDESTPQVSGTADVVSAGAASKPAARAVTQSFADTLFSAQDQAPVKSVAQPGSPAVVAAPHTPRETQFAAANHDSIVSGVHSQLLPNGGTMQIRLDPPELGAMNVSVHMKDGVMTATFETSNDQASRLLSHSLGQLKTALESEGVTVGRLHVQQAPRDSEPGSRREDKNGEGKQSASQQQQEQQRREMLRRMWKRVNGGKDPLDLVA